MAGDGKAPDTDTVRCRFCRTTFTPEVIAAEYESIHWAGLFGRGGQAGCAHCGRTETVARFVVRVTEMRAAAPDFHVMDHVVFCFACARPAIGEAVPAARVTDAESGSPSMTEHPVDSD